MTVTRIENRFLSLGVDARGRLVSLRNKATRTELIAHPEAAEAWRMVVPTGRHTLNILLGSRGSRPRIRVEEDARARRLVISFVRPGLNARFAFELERDGRALAAWAQIENSGRQAVDEVEFPVVGGFGGFHAGRTGRVMNLIAASDRGQFFGDVLNNGLPVPGWEGNHFVRELQTAMFEPEQGWGTGHGGVWLDLYGDREGVYLGRHANEPKDFALKLESSLKCAPNPGAHAYPKGAPNWLRMSALHVPRLQPGERWTSPRIVVMPHEGDWHAGADAYAAWRHESLIAGATPGWMRDFVGWQEILGSLYTGEVFHDFRTCARETVRDAKVTGINFVFYYGHTALGAEGADLDQSPARALGGEKGFRRMIGALHRAGVRVMLLDHLHRWVNSDLPEYQRLGLERYAVLDENGRPRTARWPKETFLSCRRLEGPTPVWVEMCPACKEWERLYLQQLEKTIRRGVDGVELDTFFAERCYSAKHGHAPGASVLPWKLGFLRRARERARRLNPDFALFTETMTPEVRAFADGFYTDRFPDENGRIYRYLFPEIRELAVLVGNYAYDAVNRALMLGIGVETEIMGLRKTTLAACPELARHIGEVTRFRRKHADVMMRGTFRDTLGARVTGDALFGVLEGPAGATALVLRNPHNRRVKVRASLERSAGRRLILWRPFQGERRVRALPVSLTLGPYDAAVLLARP